LKKTHRIVKAWSILTIALPMVFLIPGTALILSCSGSSDETMKIQREVVDKLLQINQTGLNTIDAELDKIAGDKYKVAVSQENLNQVLIPSLKWVEYQKTEFEKMTWGTWNAKVDSDALRILQNDRYRVTAMEVRAESMGTSMQKVTEIIQIIDLSTNSTQNWEKIENDLQQDLDNLDNKRVAKLQDRRKVEEALMEALAHWKKWKLKQINSTAYYVSGIGLGWAEKPTDGIWIIDTFAGTLTAHDEAGKALEQMLKAKF